MIDDDDDCDCEAFGGMLIEENKWSGKTEVL
jgi:hypothetical protein